MLRGAPKAHEVSLEIASDGPERVGRARVTWARNAVQTRLENRSGLVSSTGRVHSLKTKRPSIREKTSIRI